MTIKNYINELLSEGVNVIDIGSSGSLDAKWEPLKKTINLIGFDPNKDECERQNNLPSEYRTAKFLPYAVHGKNGTETLYMTKSMYCYSLLEPNKEWLDRFSFGDLFKVTGHESVDVRSIDNIEELEDYALDVMKLDVQGLELPILEKADNLLEQAFYVETETGFVENYIGETTYSQIDTFMRSKGFLLFDMNISHRISRDNNFKNHTTGKEQILWCEAVWLKDYIALGKSKDFKPDTLSENKIKKILVLCALEGCFDYGLELATFFHDNNLLSKGDLESLSQIESWMISESTVSEDGKVLLPTFGSKKVRLLARLLNVFPNNIRKAIYNASKLTLNE